MDSDTILKKMRSVYNVLTPLEVSIVSQHENAYDIKVVSESFKGVNPSDRVSRLYDLLDKAYPQMSFEYDIAFVALSPSEANGSIKGFEDADYIANQNKSQKIASKEL